MDNILLDRYSYQPQMAEKIHATPSFAGRRSFAPRPLSEATLILDTDDEDQESLPSSLEQDDESQSTISSSRDEVKTPLTGGLGGFTFHFDPKPITGPVGPHLFRTGSADSEAHILSMSPIPVPKPQPRRFTQLGRAVAELDETKVRDWSPRQVAEWMIEAGFDSSIAEKFLMHDIYGSVLVDLQLDDLKEIDIDSFGNRRRVMSSIDHLRASSMITDAPTFGSSPTEAPSRSLSRSVRPDESHVVSRTRSHRRGRSAKRSDDILPAESVSIVAIEQLLPEPHSCSKGENCPKWRKRQRKIEKLRHEFDQDAIRAADSKSTIEPSVIGSSDVLGPSAIPITAESLSVVQPRDPQENVRQFLDFQHLNSPRSNGPSPPPAPSASFITKASNKPFLGLPKLTIPMSGNDTDSPDRTPISALRNPTRVQAESKRALLNDPYHYGGVASPVDVYRVDTPMSATDIPITAMVEDPFNRDVSQSVPPEMRYGQHQPSSFVMDPIKRCASTQPPRRRQPSFVPAIATVRESEDRSFMPPVITSEVELNNHAGWMRKREHTRFLKHEWQDHYFNLNGTKLGMYQDEAPNSAALDTIDVDDYALHVYSAASSSKLRAAFKKGLGSQETEPSFAFTLVPEDQRNKKIFEKSRSHHFAVNSGRDRVEWMRKLMLAKAMKKNDETNRI